MPRLSGAAHDGLAIVSAVDGQSGPARVRVLELMVMTLAVTTPGMNGWHVLGQLKADLPSRRSWQPR